MPPWPSGASIRYRSRRPAASRAWCWVMSDPARACPGYARRPARRHPHEGSGLSARLNPHPVERAVDEHERREEEGGRKPEAEPASMLRGEIHAELYGEEAEQRRELDDRVHRNRRSVLERIT